MFIALSRYQDSAPFEGAECCWLSTNQVEVRPSERRWIDRADPGYIHFTLDGVISSHNSLA
jgi:hypothetical protein